MAQGIGSHATRWRGFALVASLPILLFACGDGDDADSTQPVTSATSTATTATAQPTIASVIASVQEWLDDNFAESEPHPGVLGAIEVQCVDSGAVQPGDVFACAGMPRTEPDFPLEPVGMVFYAVDAHGTVAWTDGTDVPETNAALRELYDAAPEGLLCRDLATSDSVSHPFSGLGRPPADGFFWSLVYWSLEGMPDRMDADLDGIPCETQYEPDVVASVLSGGPVGSDGG